MAARDRQREELLQSLFDIRPIALDVLVHSPERIELTIRVLEVPKYVEPAAGLHLPQFKLHSAVFHNQTLKLQELLAREPAVDANMADSHGNTPLHLACMLGRRTAVDVLLRYGALPSVPNKEGWHAIAEATSFGDRRILERVWFAHRRAVDIVLRLRKKTILNELATKSSDFFLQMNWKFDSWLPFTERFCPKDSLKIYKRGSSLRADFTLVGFENFSWQRGNCSFLFSVDPHTSKSTSYLLDHDRKIYQKLDDLLADEQAERHNKVKQLIKQQRQGGQGGQAAASGADERKEAAAKKDDELDPDDIELSDWSAVEKHPLLFHLLSSEVDVLMSSPISDTSSPGELVFKQATTGYFMFKKPRVDQVGDYAAHVWEVSNLNLSIRRRTEHLTPEDKARHEKLSSFFGMNRGGEVTEQQQAEDDDEEEDDDEDEDEDDDDDQEEEGDEKDEAGVMQRNQRKLDDVLRLVDRRQLRPSLPPPPEPEISFDNYLSSGCHLGREPELNETDKAFKAKVFMSETFPLKVADLLRVINVLAPHHRHLDRLRRFVNDRLPLGFPIRVQMPVFPTVKADVQFVEYEERPQDVELFLVPLDYRPGTLDLVPGAADQ